MIRLFLLNIPLLWTLLLDNSNIYYTCIYSYLICMKSWPQLYFCPLHLKKVVDVHWSFFPSEKQPIFDIIREKVTYWGINFIGPDQTPHVICRAYDICLPWATTRNIYATPCAISVLNSQTPDVLWYTDCTSLTLHWFRRHHFVVLTGICRMAPLN